MSTAKNSKYLNITERTHKAFNKILLPKQSFACGHFFHILPCNCWGYVRRRISRLDLTSHKLHKLPPRSQLLGLSWIRVDNTVYGPVGLYCQYYYAPLNTVKLIHKTYWNYCRYVQFISVCRFCAYRYLLDVSLGIWSVIMCRVIRTSGYIKNNLRSVINVSAKCNVQFRSFDVCV